MVTQYAPILYLDEKEPFRPKKVGYNIYAKSQPSKCSKRTIVLEGKVDKVIEYAVYWDYDIQHLYDLEHVWIYLDREGNVLDAEASFHGAYFKAWLKDRSNIDDKQIKLYVQPGKHAFMPKVEYFYLIPDLLTSTSSEAGKGGVLLDQSIIKERIKKDKAVDDQVERYIKQHYAFDPAMKFTQYEFDENMFIAWEELDALIPGFINAEINKIMNSR